MSLALMWALGAEAFSQLVLAQAVAAPLLFFFISPGWALYRMYSSWKANGPSDFAARLHALRVMGWMMGLLAILLAGAVAWIAPIGGESHLTAFYSVLWAFSLYVGGHLSAADRELLRLELRFRELNLITIFQKGTLLATSVLIAFEFGGRPQLLALAAVSSMIATAWLARWRAGRVLLEAGASTEAIAGRSGPLALQTIQEVLTGFSLWNHASGVVLNWVQSLDVFFLGLFRIPGAQIGLYGAALKVANTAYALPNALGNLFLVWVGRRSPNGFDREYREIRNMTALLAAGSALQGTILFFLAPWIVSLLSHGRWAAEEQAETVSWMRWMLAGASIFAVSFLLNSWLVLRAAMKELFRRVYFPWFIFSALLYASCIYLGGTNWAALANVPVAIFYVTALMVELLRVRHVLGVRSSTGLSDSREQNV